MTARAVALARSQLERPQTADGDPEAERRLYAGLRAAWLWPVAVGLRGWMAARTRFFDEATLGAIERGVRQVVVVGAGYDGRALRFHQPGLRFFEVDQASTQADKRRRVERLGLAFQPIDYVACDLTRDDLAGALAEAGYAAGQPALFVCEGLLLYLDPPVAEELLRALHSCAAPGSRLALSAHELPPEAGAAVRLRTAAQRLLLAAIREPRRSFYGPGELKSLLAHSGWCIVDGQAHHGAGAGQTGMLLLAEP